MTLFSGAPAASTEERATSFHRDIAEASPPLKKGGRGDLLSALANRLQNRLQYGARFQQRLPIIESQDPQAKARQECIAASVPCESVGGEMLAAIQLDHQIRGWPVEIDDVASQRLLPVELHAIKLFPAQVEPQPLLGVGHVTAQPARMGFQVAVIETHPESESPLPPFSKGGKSSISRKESPLPPVNRSGTRTPQLHGTATEGTHPLKGNATEGTPPLKKGGRGDLLHPGRSP